jgi:hypothetical protein
VTRRYCDQKDMPMISNAGVCGSRSNHRRRSNPPGEGAPPRASFPPKRARSGNRLGTLRGKPRFANDDRAVTPPTPAAMMRVAAEEEQEEPAHFDPVAKTKGLDPKRDRRIPALANSAGEQWIDGQSKTVSRRYLCVGDRPQAGHPPLKQQTTSDL